MHAAIVVILTWARAEEHAMDDDAPTPENPVESPGESPGEGVAPSVAQPSWTAMDDGVPEVRAEHTAPTLAAEPVRPPVTPWWSTAANAGPVSVPPRPQPQPERAAPARGSGRPVLLAALVGALVASLVTGLLFVAFRDTTSTTASSSATTPASITGAGAGDTVPLPQSGAGGIDIHAVLARIQPAVVRIKISTADGSAAGTGIVIDPNGTIVTNAHVVDGADTIQVQLPNGDVAPATARGVDATDDLAVVTIPRHNLATAVLGDSDALSVGDPVVAVGNALNLGISVTSGIVSAIDRDVPEENGNTLYGALQTDAAINPGNSGGPLVNAQGQVVGINTAIAPPTDANNVGFAIAISAAKPLITDLAAGRTAHHALLGVTSQDVTPALVTQDHLKVSAGAYVVQVNASTAAARAGIARGDVIVSLDGRTVATVEQMRRYIRRHQPGDKVAVIYVRPDGSRHTATVALGSD